jgi:hypothetical protein
VGSYGSCGVGPEDGVAEVTELERAKAERDDAYRQFALAGPAVPMLNGAGIECSEVRPTNAPRSTR